MVSKRKEILLHANSILKLIESSTWRFWLVFIHFNKTKLVLNSLILRENQSQRLQSENDHSEWRYIINFYVLHMLFTLFVWISIQFFVYVISWKHHPAITFFSYSLLFIVYNCRFQLKNVLKVILVNRKYYSYKINCSFIFFLKWNCPSSR